MGVTNDIRFHPHVKLAAVRDKIEAVFERSAEIDARRVNVTALDGDMAEGGSYGAGQMGSVS